MGSNSVGIGQSHDWRRDAGSGSGLHQLAHGGDLQRQPSPVGDPRDVIRQLPPRHPRGGHNNYVWTQAVKLGGRLAYVSEVDARRLDAPGPFAESGDQTCLPSDRRGNLNVAGGGDQPSGRAVAGHVDDPLTEIA